MTIKVTVPSFGWNNLSPDGVVIHAICIYFRKKGIKQNQLPDLTKKFRKEITPYKVIKYERQISSAKTEEGDDVKEIRGCLEKLLLIGGYVLSDDYYVPDKKTIKNSEPDKYSKLPFTFKKINKNGIDIKAGPTLNTKELGQYGITGILDKHPFHNKEHKEAIKNAYELRILQSSFYSWRQTREVIKDALYNGQLRKIKILLAQPYSTMATERAHTFGGKDEDQFKNINDELEESILGLMNLAKELKKKKGYKIELRLYYRPNSFPMYQCLDRDGKNIITHIGLFWQGKSSYNSPHFKIEGADSSLLPALNNHFNEIWKTKEEKELEDSKLSKTATNKSPKPFNWKTFLGEKSTTIIEQDQDYKSLFKNLQKAYYLRFFSNYSNENPKWIYFKCFYHNFHNEARDFLLQIDPEQRIAKITETELGNKYYGIVTKLHDSYSVYLHTNNDISPDRTIFMNIPVGGMKMRNKKYCFTIYNNNHTRDGSPYSQIMILQKIPSKLGYKDVKNDFRDFSPEIKDKMSIIPKDLWNLNNPSELKVIHNYVFYYRQDEREKFYQKVMMELSRAKKELYFLGYGPIHFPDINQRFLVKYLDKHQELLESGVQVYRILLDKTVNKEFLEAMINIKKDKRLKDTYKIYVAKHPIPFVADVALIDPTHNRNRSAVLLYTKTRPNSGPNYNRPIKMEVLKNTKTDKEVLENLYTNCIDYIALAKKNILLEELVSVKDLQTKLTID